MPISFVDTTARSTTWPIRLNTDLIFLEKDNVSIVSLPVSTVLSRVNPSVRSTNYSTWDFIFSTPLTEVERNALVISLKGILRIDLGTDPATLDSTNLAWGSPSTLPAGVTFGSAEKLGALTGGGSRWQLKFSRILTQTELEALEIHVDGTQLIADKIHTTQPLTESITYLRIRVNSDLPTNRFSTANLRVAGLPPGVTLVSIEKENAGSGFSLWDIRFSRDLTRFEIRSLVITVTGVTDEHGVPLTEQPITDSTTYVNPLTRLPANTQTFFDGVRYLLSVDLTEDDLPNEIIASDVYLGSASRFVSAQLKLTDQSAFDSYTDEYKARLLNSIQHRIAAKLIPALPQIIEADILESRVRYSEVDWQSRIQLFLNESGGLLEGLVPEGEEGDLYGGGVIPFTKACGRFVAF